MESCTAARSTTDLTVVGREGSIKPWPLRQLFHSVISPIQSQNHICQDFTTEAESLRFPHYSNGSQYTINMKFQTFQLATLFSVLTSSALAQRSYDNCTTFNWEPKEPFFRYRTTPQRISAAITCPTRANSTHGCALLADGDIQVSWSTHYNSTYQDHIPQAPNGRQLESHLLGLVKGATNYSDFDSSVVTTISQTVVLESGKSGYLNFYPLERCVTGTMSGCNGTIVDNFPIEICAPAYTTSGSKNASRLDGRVAIQNVSAADVANFTNPFRGQTRGESGDSAAGRGAQLAWGVFSAAVLGVGFLLM